MTEMGVHNNAKAVSFYEGKGSEAKENENTLAKKNKHHLFFRETVSNIIPAQ